MKLTIGYKLLPMLNY